MPRQSVTAQSVVRTGLAPAFAAPNTDGDIIDTGAVALWVKNGSASPVTVTVVSTATLDGLDVVDQVVSVPAAGERLIGPFPRGTFGQPLSDSNAGRALVNYSAVTSVTRAVVKI